MLEFPDVTPLDKHCLCQDYEYKKIEKAFRNHRKTTLLVFELQCYSDVYNNCWVGKLQEICQGRETRGGHQQDREQKTENAFVCRLGWLTWLENNNRPPFSLTNPLLWFIRYNIIDSHWRWFGIHVLLVTIVYVYTVHLLLEEFRSLFTHCPIANPYCFSSWH